MSRIDELIQELCPNGVEYKTLGEICELSAGGDVPKDHFSKELTEHYSIPIYSNGTEENALYGYTDTAKIIKPCVTVAARGTIGYCSLRKAPFYPVVRLICAIPQKNVLVEFLKYYIDTIKFQVPTTGIPQLTVPMVSKYKVPVPPLPVQREIVRILDNFTELAAELTAELTARKKQYEYYRNQLLTFGDDVPIVTIQDVCLDICSGGTPPTKHSEYYNGGIPWLRTQEVDWTNIEDTGVKITEAGLANSSAKWIPAHCVIVAMYGATAAKVAINNISLTTNQACCNLRINNEVALYKYVFYWLSREYLKLKSLGQGSQSNINAQTVKQYPIPLPSIHIQKQIIDLLDKFDTLCTDISAGLPAEIDARQKQYEYYRDKLLNFKEVE